MNERVKQASFISLVTVRLFLQFETLRKLGEKSPIRRTVDSLFHRACLRLIDSNAIHLLLNKLKQLLDKDDGSTDDNREEDEASTKEDSGMGCDVSSAVLLVQVIAYLKQMNWVLVLIVVC